MAAGAIAIAFGVPGLAASAGDNPGGPPGNNGTIKVDDVPFDDHPDNEPHVGCVFQVDFYGYDEGDLFADVTFEMHPPTGPKVVILEDQVDIGEDDNSGGGSEAGLDASRTYDLSEFLVGEPHDVQGWHVKLTINADGSQGADTKHKVFWVDGCGPEETTTTSTTSTSTTSTTEPTTSTSESTTTTVAETTSTSESTTTTTEGSTTTSESTTTSTTDGSTTTTEGSTSSTTEGSTTTTTEGSTTSTTEPTTTTTEGSTTTSESTTTSVEDTTTTTLPSSTTSTIELNTTVTEPTTTVPTPGGSLPNTGSGSSAMLAVAGVALLLGGAALTASTRLRPQSG